MLSSKLQTDVTTNVVTGKAVAFYAIPLRSAMGFRRPATSCHAAYEVSPRRVRPSRRVIPPTTRRCRRPCKAADDGTYEKILKHWGAEGGAVTKAEINLKVED